MKAKTDTRLFDAYVPFDDAPQEMNIPHDGYWIW